MSPRDTRRQRMARRDKGSAPKAKPSGAAASSGRPWQCWASVAVVMAALVALGLAALQPSEPAPSLTRAAPASPRQDGRRSAATVDLGPGELAGFSKGGDQKLDFHAQDDAMGTLVTAGAPSGNDGELTAVPRGGLATAGSGGTGRTSVRLLDHKKIACSDSINTNQKPAADDSSLETHSQRHVRAPEEGALPAALSSSKYDMPSGHILGDESHRLMYGGPSHPQLYRHLVEVDSSSRAQNDAAPYRTGMQSTQHGHITESAADGSTSNGLT